MKTELDNQQPAILDRKPFSASPDNYLSPCIIVRSDWWISGRQNELKVVIELKVPEEIEEEIDELPQDICNCLKRLGKIKNEIYIAVPNEDESRRIQSISPKAVQLIKEMNNNMSDILKDLSLPYELINYNNTCGTFDSVSPKKEIIKTFKSRKYKYLSNFSGQGVYYLVKRTKTNNQIKLLFDFAPIMRDFSLIFIYQGPFWEHELKLKFFPSQNHHRYPIRGEEVLMKVVSNAGEIVDYLEKSLVMDLDNLYGDVPTWFEYQK